MPEKSRFLCAVSSIIAQYSASCARRALHREVPTWQSVLNASRRLVSQEMEQIPRSQAGTTLSWMLLERTCCPACQPGPVSRQVCLSKAAVPAAELNCWYLFRKISLNPLSSHHLARSRCGKKSNGCRTNYSLLGMFGSKWLGRPAAPRGHYPQI